jgi:hypothetical protein
VRVEPRRSVGEVRGSLWIRGIQNIDHHDTGLRLQRVIFRCHVDAVIKVRRPILRKGALPPELADEREIAVIAEFRAAARAFLRSSLALQTAFSAIRRAALGLGHRSHLVGPFALGVGEGRTAEQNTQQQDS